MKLKRWTRRAAALAVAGAALIVAAQEKSETSRAAFRRIVIDRDPPARPGCKTTGDIDGDGFLDVLAAGWMSNGLYWYAWPGWSKHRIDTGSFTTDMQTADIDNDGDSDVVIPRDGNSLVWYENPRPNGNPAADPWKRHRIADEGAHDLEVGDIDRNGKIDVVARHGQTRVYLQVEPDRWTRIAIETHGRGGTALGDLDGDGDLDIAQNGYWIETPKDKQGEWKKHEFAAGAPEDVGVHIADLNKDRRMDIVMAPAEAPGRLVWYEMSGPKGKTWKEHVIAEEVSHLHTFKTADIDRDGNLDLVTAEMEQTPKGRVTIHYNLGRGLKWGHQEIAHTGSHNLRLADIGNDGDIDIIGANHGNSGGATPIEYWENLKSKPSAKLALNRWQRHVIDDKRPWRAVFITPADIDADGRIDIAAGGWWYRNPGEPGGSWTRHTVGEPLNQMAAVYDFDRDGYPDVLGTQGKAAEKSADFVWARNDGKGSFRIFNNIAKAEGDFLQGVGIVRNRVGGPMEVALSWHAANKGIQMFTVPVKAMEEQWTWRRISDVSQDEDLSVADIGRDNKLDLLLGTKWLQNDGAKWIAHTLNGVEGHADRNRWADMNGDGRPDAVVGYEAINVPGKLAWYEHPADPKGTWTEHVISMDITGPMSLDTADLDRDGDMDIVVGEHNYKDPATARLLVLENEDGKGGKWLVHEASKGDEHHDGAILTDIDRDGDLDIISLGWRHDRVLVYENRAIGRK